MVTFRSFSKVFNRKSKPVTLSDLARPMTACMSRAEQSTVYGCCRDLELPSFDLQSKEN